jgi:hypothetical protein
MEDVIRKRFTENLGMRNVVGKEDDMGNIERSDIGGPKLS